MNTINLAMFNVTEFDQLVHSFYEGNNTERQKAQTLLTEFRKNPDSWQVADQILEHSSSFQSKFIALGILQDFVKVKWNLLPMNQRLAMRNYVVKLIIGLASDENMLRSKSAYINKLDQILVQILKKDWPKYWPTFIQEMIDSSLANTTLCENNMKILKYLSEEVFDFSNDFMTVANKTKLKNQMVAEFSPVFDLCKKVLSTTPTNLHLTTATLEALLKFITWIPLEYLYQQDLMQRLEVNFKQAQTPYQRNLCLQCFTELINLEAIDIQQQGPFLLGIFNFIYNEITGILPANIDINQLYTNSSNEEQEFFQLLTIFLTSYLSKYKALTESIENGKSAVHQTLQYLLKLSRIPEREIWKICLEFWGNQSITEYTDILQELCHIMIDNMVKPDDIFMIENDDGEIIREFIKQSDTTAISKSMQLTFNQLTRIQPIYVQSMIHEKLKQLQLTNSTWDQLFRLSWVIGYMSGALSDQDEDTFLSTVVLQDIFQLLQNQQSNQDQEWVVASCLFYIVEQYPRFLMSHLDFASFLFQRMFGYIQHPQRGVRDMACDAFAKISKGCKQELTQPFLNGQSILEFALLNISKLTSQLGCSQILLYYEAVSTIIASLPTVQAQEQPILMLMEAPNTTMHNAVGNMSSLNDVRAINNVIRLNTVVCKSLGSVYQYQLQKLISPLTQIYEISSQQKKSANTDFYHRVCESVIKLIEAFILSQEQLDSQNFIFNLVQVIIMDYKNTGDPLLKESHVLQLLIIVIEKLQKPVWPEFLKEVIDVEYATTLPLITSNFVDYPDIRLEFYRLLQALNKHCFTELYQSPQLFQLNTDSIMWGTKHTLKDISEISLQTCLDMIQYVSQMEDEDISSQFFESYYVRILTDILEILVDPDCRNAFKLQSHILARLLELVQEGEIYTRLYSSEQMASSNVEYIQKYVLDLLCTAFPLLQKDQIEVLVMGMFEYSGEQERFQDDIRDFLIDIREVGDESEGQQRADDELNAELDLLRNS